MAVVVGGAVIVGLGATGAVAGKLVTSAGIANNTIRSIDVRDGNLRGVDLSRESIASGHIRNGTIRMGDLSTSVRDAIAGPATAPADGISGLEAASLDAPVTIADIGGSINDRNTDLETGLTLPAGRYLVTVDGSFESDTAATTAADVYPQLSLWIDRSGDGDFQWQSDEGDISPNALMPTAAKRHIAVSGSTVIELTEATYVGLLGFGYDSAQGTARSGEIDVTSATITATPLN